MNRILSIIMVAIFALSCSESEQGSVVIEPTELTILSEVDGSSRLSGTQWDEGDKIGIYMSYFNVYSEFESNVAYQTSSGDGLFTPCDESDKIYYPSNTAAVDISAYYPYRVAASELGRLYVDVASEKQHDMESIDLLHSFISGVTFSEREDPVIFTFRHRLSRLDLTLSPGDGFELSDLVGMGVTISKQPTSAVYYLRENTLSSFKSVEDEGDDISLHLTPIEGGYNAAAILLPHTTDQSCCVTIALKGGESYTFDLHSVELCEGQNLCYSLSVNKRGVEQISSNIVDWGSEDHVGFGADFISINSEADLIAFRDRVNAGESVNAMLMQDITLTEASWTPIGTDRNPFVASFNGGGHSISGLTISAEHESYQALFGIVGDGVGASTIENLTIKEPQICGGTSCAAMVGRSNRAMFVRCSVEGGVISGSSSVGGVVGTAISTTLKFCGSTAAASVGGVEYPLVGDLREGSLVIE